MTTAPPALPGRARSGRFQWSHKFTRLLLGKADMRAVRRADQIASLKPFATRNATFFDALLALIWISSPVAGLRPLRAGRAGRIRTCRTPRLGMRILLPFFST